MDIWQPRLGIPSRGCVSYSSAPCYAASSCGYGDGFCNGGADAVVEGFGDDIVLREFIVGDELCQRVRGGDLHLLVDVACAHALAELISDEELSEDYIIPKAFDHRVGPAVAKAVAEAARRTGVAYAAAAHRTIL